MGGAGRSPGVREKLQCGSMSIRRKQTKMIVSNSPRGNYLFIFKNTQKWLIKSKKTDLGIITAETMISWAF
jgi:hypothetical protein